MAFNRPSLATLVARIQADFVSRLSLVGAVLRRSVVYVFARVFAGAVHMLHGHLEYLGTQLFADQSEAEFLLRQGATFNVNPKAATFAHLTVTLTGTAGTVTAGHVLSRSDGSTYTTDADVTLASGTATVAITATVADSNSNCDAGVSLAFVSPVSGVNSAAVVVSTTVDGTDAEQTEAYRARVLARLGTPPQGGSAADYQAWALAVPGVTQAWTYPGANGAGSVVLRFMLGNQIPDSPTVTLVQNTLNALKPVTAALTVMAPVASPLNFTVHLVPDTTDTRAAVQAELLDLLNRQAIPGGTIPLSNFDTAIGVAAGVTDYTLTSPSAAVVAATGYITTLGTITYV